MKNYISGRFSVVALIVLLSACAPSAESPRGFSLPEGDPQEGREAFLELGCNACHTVSGVELPAPEVAGPVSVELGGGVTVVETYGQLVTSIINPSHRVAPRLDRAEVVDQEGESMMPSFNQQLSVQDLIDLVAFLQPTYEVVPPEYDYRVYTY